MFLFNSSLNVCFSFLNCFSSFIENVFTFLGPGGIRIWIRFMLIQVRNIVVSSA